jgi:hypothetical protein
VSWFLPPGFRFFASGVGVLVILLVIPGGLGSVLYQLRDAFLRAVAKRRRIIVPSLVADTKSGDLAYKERASVDFLQLTRMDDTTEAPGLPPGGNGSRRSKAKTR